VCVDETSDAVADIPDLFAAVQWTRLTRGETPHAFVDRVSRLLSPDENGPLVPARPAPNWTVASVGYRVTL